VSPPLDLAACADALERPQNRLYQLYFMHNLREGYRVRQRLRPDLYAAGRERGLRTVRAYDDAITAPYGGHGSAAEYYARSSAGPWLMAITNPALILAADDDPMVPGASVARWPLPASGVVQRQMLPTGGHVGFVAPSAAPVQFWAAERVVAFLDASRAASGILSS
jgi:predicted alpha/beta-fold hydrolase